MVGVGWTGSKCIILKSIFLDANLNESLANPQVKSSTYALIAVAISQIHCFRYVFGTRMRGYPDYFISWYISAVLLVVISCSC